MVNYLKILALLFLCFFLEKAHAQSLTFVDTVAFSALQTALDLQDIVPMNDGHFLFEEKIMNGDTVRRIKSIIDSDISQVEVGWVWVKSDSLVAEVYFTDQGAGFDGFWRYTYSPSIGWMIVNKNIEGSVTLDDHIFLTLAELEFTRLYSEWRAKVHKYGEHKFSEIEGVKTHTISFEKRVITDTSQTQFKVIFQTSVIKQGSVTTIVYLNAHKNLSTDLVFKIEKYYLFLADQQSILDAKMNTIEQVSGAVPVSMNILLEILQNTKYFPEE